RRVKVRVVGDHIAPLAHHAEQDAFGGPSLMGGDYVPESEDLGDGIAEAQKAGTAGVTLVAAHHARPLLGGHGAGAGVGEQVDQDVFGGQQKKVVVGGAQELLALLARGPADGLNALNAKRFNDGADGHKALSIVPRNRTICLVLEWWVSFIEK